MMMLSFTTTSATLRRQLLLLSSRSSTTVVNNHHHHCRSIHIEKKLTALGIELPPAPMPKANYNIMCIPPGENVMYLSGHLPIKVSALYSVCRERKSVRIGVCVGEEETATFRLKNIY
jgi:hypothetical protein